MKFWIRTGLKTFGGLRGGEWEMIDTTSELAAKSIAEDYAQQEYDQYAGTIGMRTLDQIISEEMVTLADAEGIYNRERDAEVVFEVSDRDPKQRDTFEAMLASGHGSEDDLYDLPIFRQQTPYESRQDDLDAAFGLWGDEDGDDFTPEIEAEIAAEEEAERLANTKEMQT